jgi:hypothetical protein
VQDRGGDRGASTPPKDSPAARTSAPLSMTNLRGTLALANMTKLRVTLALAIFLLLLLLPIFFGEDFQRIGFCFC